MPNNNEHIEQEEKGMLNKIPKQNNFKIPSNYFENLSEKIEYELHLNQNTKTNKTKKKAIFTMVVNLSIAAAVVLGVFIFKPSASKNDDVKTSVIINVSEFQDSFISMDDLDIAFFEFDENLEAEVATLLYEYEFEEIDTYSDDISIEFDDDFEL